MTWPEAILAVAKLAANALIGLVDEDLADRWLPGC